jgi:phosphatidylglycerol:prolipoprotein diacylglycerol transferase
LAVRGYGAFLTLAILLSVVLVVIRCRQIGLNPEKAVSLCFWMVISGIIGARVFYVVQKWEDFGFTTVRELLVGLLDMTKGGLVVYGSVMGGMIAVGIFLWRTKMPARLTLDVLAPAFLIGLAVGRIGCLMNGCCYGGVCSEQFLLGLRFPVGSPPYMQQLEQGQLLGLEGHFVAFGDNLFVVDQVRANGLIARRGLPIKVGDKIRIEFPASIYVQAIKEGRIDLPLNIRIERELDGSTFSVPVEQIPNWSLPVHPTQVYATISAGLLCAVLWFYFPFRTFDGELFALVLILYPISRYFEEIVRDDEQGIFRSQLTISQWASLAMLVIGIAVFVGFKNANRNPEPLSPRGAR